MNCKIRGLTGKNILNQQLQTGGIEMPSIGDTLKESGAVDISLLEDQDSENEQEEEENNEISIGHGLLTLAKNKHLRVAKGATRHQTRRS